MRQVLSENQSKVRDLYAVIYTWTKANYTNVVDYLKKLRKELGIPFEKNVEEYISAKDSMPSPSVASFDEIYNVLHEITTGSMECSYMFKIDNTQTVGELANKAKAMYI